MVFPANKKVGTVYNDCSSDGCPLWYSAEKEVIVRGTPFQVDTSKLGFNELSAQVFVNFTIGASVILLPYLVLKKRNKK